jgi:hypothetical protein
MAVVAASGCLATFRVDGGDYAARSGRRPAADVFHFHGPRVTVRCRLQPGDFFHLNALGAMALELEAGYPRGCLSGVSAVRIRDGSRSYQAAGFWCGGLCAYDDALLN